MHGRIGRDALRGERRKKCRCEIRCRPNTRFGSGAFPTDTDRQWRGRAGEKFSREIRGRPNGPTVKLQAAIKCERRRGRSPRPARRFSAGRGIRRLVGFCGELAGPILLAGGGLVFPYARVWASCDLFCAFTSLEWLAPPPLCRSSAQNE